MPPESRDTLATLLTEIRDLQRQQLEAYRQIAGEALALQRDAVARQRDALELTARTGALYRRVVTVGAVLVAGLLGMFVALVR